MQRTTTPFRITLILDDKSAVAQLENMERIIDDDGTTVISSRALPAVPLEFPLADSILGAVNAAALARIEALEADLKAAQEGPQPEKNTIRAWQAKAVLALAGLLKPAEAAIAALPEPQRTVVLSAWENNADFARTAPTILSLGAALGLTDEQLDALFQQAAALSV